MKADFTEADITLKVDTYAQKDRLGICLYSQGEERLKPFASLTVNLPHEPAKANEAFIMDISGNGGLLNFVLDNHLGTLCPERGHSALFSYPKVAFDMKKLKEFDREGTEQYLRNVEKSHVRTKKRAGKER